MQNAILLITIAFGFGACAPQGGAATDETPTRGNINISIDESYQPVFDSEIRTFTSFYPYATINASYKPETDVINDLIRDSARVIVVGSKLTAAQDSFLRQSLVIARTTLIAYDAVAFIVNKDNADSLFRYSTIKSMFTGEIDTWKQINAKSKLGKIKLVFDHAGSSNIRYLKHMFIREGNLPEICYAVKNNAEVVNFVENNKDAIGVIGVNWISDPEDSTTINFKSRVQVVHVSNQFIESEYYGPYQGFIAQKSYPFIREVYMISRETFSGLGSGFIQWVAADQGQRILLKGGLLPATMPIRLMQVTKDDRYKE